MNPLFKLARKPLTFQEIIFMNGSPLCGFLHLLYHNFNFAKIIGKKYELASEYSDTESTKANENTSCNRAF